MRSELIGPAAGPDELIDDPPERRYTLGTLFPIDAAQEQMLREDVDDNVVGSARDDVADDPIVLANQWMPSSVGVSFFVVGTNSIRVSAWAARYEAEKSESITKWRRVEIASASSPVSSDLEWSMDNLTPEADTLDGRARLRCHARPLGEGHLVTVTLVNSQSQDRADRIDSAKCLLQVGIACSPVDGAIAEYPKSDLLTRDDEDAELQLIYRHAKTFAIGHGCAAGWNQDGPPDSVVTEFLPSFETPSLEPVLGDLPVLTLNHLADPAVEPDQLVGELKEFAAGYGLWIDGQEELRDDLSEGYRPAAERLLHRMRSAQRRMLAGAELLGKDAEALRAFRLANEAMQMQMYRSKVVARKRRELGVAGDVAGHDAPAPDYRWYPFQLAFILISLPSLVDSNHRDRQMVDLIWFPTGGGKTEAYLALAAIDVFLRRLRAGDRGAGTAVIMRYTLRLLTAQQFQRAAALACACEALRRDAAPELGSDSITIGLWIGQDAAPNRYLDACERLDAIQDGTSSDSFLQLDRCPWCGTALIPEDREALDAYGVAATATSFGMFCPDDACRFHDSLPVAVVDEQMYDEPPTILIGTVDKFAQLTWSDRGGAFFGLDRHLPPSLIIQDELHLISGPLGTVVGVYESAIQGLLKLADANPKIIASTATIRRSADQVLGLFCRPVTQFPPSGLSAVSSYFAREVRETPGRLYVGVMSQSHTPSTSLIHLVGALAQGPIERGFTDAQLDSYWTSVVYHNSLRELGKTVTYARDDIPARVKVIASDDRRLRRLTDDELLELTSNVPSSEIPARLERLFRTFSENGAVSLLMATNMIQVGIDVPRLGLMVVNGQPKTTSEYIQASSRIGRGDWPGLVVTLYSSSKPRDRSHLEDFVPYHAALYRHVEPTSVTPFALPARRRALHAALVILVRHGIGLSANDAAGRFGEDQDALDRVRSTLLEWVAQVDPQELDATEAHLDELIGEWKANAGAAARDGSPLHYTGGRQHRRLLKRYFQPGDGWETLEFDAFGRQGGDPRCGRCSTLMPERKLRLSQTLSPFGVGAIYDVLGESFVARDITAWRKHAARMLDAPRLASSIGVSELREAPARSASPDAPPSAGVPFSRFPRWLFCGSCRRMVHWSRRDEQPGAPARCRNCRSSRTLVPMRFITVCTQGHMDDVPWGLWAHSKSDEPDQKQCERHDLEFVSSAGRGGGLASLLVRCRTCKAARSLAGITGPRSLAQLNLRCRGIQPWQAPRAELAHDDPPEVVQRGAGNVYFAKIQSAIVIPPESSWDERRDLAHQILSDPKFEVILTSPTGPVVSALVGVLSETYGVPTADVESLVETETRRRAGAATSPGPVDIAGAEWLAFQAELVESDHRDRFITRHIDLSEVGTSGLPYDDLLDQFNRVVQVVRLNEVRALEGFSRIEPGNNLVPPDLGKGVDWRPGLEVFGEGIFVSLDEQRVARWERGSAAGRVAALAERQAGAFGAAWLPGASPRFVLLHTFAHLLIRQLAFEAGYSAASLRERIYARVAGDGEPMAGVLVYTASGDQEGTLGGLARQAEIKRLGPTILAALERAIWCSSDPICRESPGQGVSALNLAACHACALVAETSCTSSNALLDRMLVVGSPEPGVSFFGRAMESVLAQMAGSVES